MNSKSHRPMRPFMGLAIFTIVAGLTVFMSGQQRGQMASPQSNMHVPILTSGPQEEELPGLPDDWSFHHLTFTDPGTEEDAIDAGRHDEWLRIVNNPRYLIQQLKRRQPVEGPWADEVAKLNAKARAQEEAGEAEPSANPAEQLESYARPVKGHRPVRPVKEGIDRDWSMYLAQDAAASFTATVAAPASGNISGSSTLVVDGVTLNASPPTAAVGTVQVNCTTASCGTYTLTIGTMTYSIQSSLSGNSPANQVLDGGSGTGHTNTAKNLRAAMLNQSSQCGSTSGGTCFRNLAGANPTVTPGTGANPLSLTAATLGTGGNSTVLSDTGCIYTQSPCTGVSGDPTEVSLDSTNTQSTVISTTFGATGTAGTDGTTSGSPPTFAYWSVNNYATQSALASNLASAINTNPTLETASTGVSATSNSNTSSNLTITALSSGTAGNSYTVAAGSFGAFTPASGSLSGGSTGGMAAGQYPAKFSFSTTSAKCSDYVVYPTGAVGTSSQATIVAFNNLYSGCSGSVPGVYWAYNAPVSSTNGVATLSPVIDFNGTQVAFVETVSGTSYLVLLRMTNTGSTVTTATSVANSSYNGCTAPCSTTFSLGTTDSNSPPFYDYKNDAIYVGDDAGNVHRFSTVFRGAPAAGFTTSVTGVETNKHLTGPVVDPNSGLIFVSDNSGYLHSITSSGGSVLTSGHMDFNVGFSDAPLVDSTTTTSFVYTFGQHTTTTYINQFNASSSISGSTGTAKQIGSYASTTLPVYVGAFDNQHSTASNGNLYFCALASSSSTAYPTLYQLAMNSTFTGTATAYNTVANGNATCSPVTEFYNGTTDNAYLSVTANGSATGCPGACIYNYSLPTSGSGTAGSARAGMSVAGGASGVIIDNNVPSGTLAGASQIYFSSLGSETCSTSGGTGACAVQASQAIPANATGTVTLITDPGTWPGNQFCTLNCTTPTTITVGSTTYTFKQTLNGSGAQILGYGVGGTAQDEADTAQNLAAAIMDNQSLCSTDSGQPCFSNVTVPNPSVTATYSSNVTTLTATTPGSAGDFTLTTNYSTGITVNEINGSP